MNTSWQLDHDACERRHRHIMGLLTDRSRLKVSAASRSFASLTEEARLAVAQFSVDVVALGERRNDDATRRERERRSRLVEALKSKERSLRELLQAGAAAGNEDRKRLFLLEGKGVADLGPVDWGDREDEESGGGRHLQVRAQIDTEAALAAQDEGLDSLHEVIVRQKRLARTIGGEVAAQNEILEDIGDTMDQTRQRLLETTRGVIGVQRRSGGTCGYWVVIILLLVVIVVLSSMKNN